MKIWSYRRKPAEREQERGTPDLRHNARPVLLSIIKLMTILRLQGKFSQLQNVNTVRAEEREEISGLML